MKGNKKINGEEFFDVLFNVGFIGVKGHKMLCEFTGANEAIPGEIYFGQFAKLAVFLDMSYGITSAKEIETNHVYEFLEFLKELGFKDSTLKYYITSVRQVYQWHKELFSESFLMPTTSGWDAWST